MRGTQGWQGARRPEEKNCVFCWTQCLYCRPFSRSTAALSAKESLLFPAVPWLCLQRSAGNSNSSPSPLYHQPDDGPFGAVLHAWLQQPSQQKASSSSPPLTSSIHIPQGGLLIHYVVSEAETTSSWVPWGHCYTMGPLGCTAMQHNKCGLEDRRGEAALSISYLPAAVLSRHNASGAFLHRQ